MIGGVYYSIKNATTLYTFMYFTNNMYLKQLVRDKMLAIFANAKITFIIQLLYNIKIKLSFSSKTSLAIKWKLLSTRLFYASTFKPVTHLLLRNGDLNFKSIYKSMLFPYSFRMFIASDYIVFVLVPFIEYFFEICQIFLKEWNLFYLQ